jgi:hypothetical protein
MKIKEESLKARGRCSALDHKEATLDSVLALHSNDVFSVLVSQVDNQECKLLVKDFKLLSYK